MTDTKHISDAINGLPDDGYIGVQQRDTRDYDDFCKTDDLKALVAENEALKEAAQSALAFMLHCDLDGLDEASKPETELLRKALTTISADTKGDRR